MPTETITLTYGSPNSTDAIDQLLSSTFRWTITNVGSTGTFADNTPWVVMGSTGSFLTNISPRSYGITTSQGSPTLVYINGSAKNLHTSQSKYNKNTMESLSSPIVFDSRIASAININYGLTFNIGYTSGGSGAALNSVGLTFGDSIITADSFWIQAGNPLIGTSVGGYTIIFNPESNPRIPNNIASSGNGEITNIITPLKRLGVINVLQSAPAEKCFRPPAQWKDSTTRPLIPVSHAKGITAIADVLGYYNDNFSPWFGISHGLTFNDTDLNTQNDSGTSLIYHSSNDSRYQSYIPLLAVSQLRKSITTDWSCPYYTASRFIVSLFTSMCNTYFSVKDREEARNRFIQYGIDAFGAVMAGNDGRGSGGHFTATFLEPILITGWLLGSTYGNQMVDIYNTVRAEYSGLSLASDKTAGQYFFKSHYSYDDIKAGSTLGYHHRQTYVPWYPGIGATFTYGVSAGEVDYTQIASPNDIPIGGTTFGRGKYAKLNVAGGGTIIFNNLAQGFRSYTDSNYSGFSKNYPGSYLKVTGGPGAGDTIYRVLQVGEYNLGDLHRAKEYIILDRPWINGTPTNQSTIELYPFRTGQYSWDGSTADVGRHVHHSSIESITIGASDKAWGYPTLYYETYNYGGTVFMGHLGYWCALKKIHEVTGNQNFVKSPGFKYFTENFLGYHKDVHTQVPFSTTPREEYFLHLGWLDPILYNPNPIGRLNLTTNKLFKQWIGFTGSTGYGNGTWTTIPGYTLQYNASGLTELLGNFGKPGRNDYNFNGATDAADMAWFLSKWGQ